MTFWNLIPLGFNRYIVIGILLGIIGFFLSPFIIGIPIMALGWMMATFGVFWFWFNLIPGSKNLKKKVKQYFKDYVKMIYRK